MASIPRFLKGVVDNDGPNIRDAAVLHDFLYSSKSDLHYKFIKKSDADYLLRVAMEDLGAGIFIRWLVYTSVQLFGNSHYKGDS
jgi:hypothetical protein